MILGGVSSRWTSAFRRQAKGPCRAAQVRAGARRALRAVLWPVADTARAPSRTYLAVVFGRGPVDSCFAPTVHAELPVCGVDAARRGLGMAEYAYNSNRNLWIANRATGNRDAALRA